MLIYVYAVLGTQLFFNLKHQVVVTNKMNFHTFLSSVTALMRLSTGERWNLVMHECMVQVITEHRPILARVSRRVRARGILLLVRTTLSTLLPRILNRSRELY